MFSSDNLQTYHWGELYRLKNEIDTCFASLKQSIQFHENLIHDELFKLEVYTREHYSKFTMDEETKSHYEYQVYEPAKNAIYTMKYLQRNGALMALFTILESKLKILCQLLETELNLEKELNKKSPGDNDIDKIRVYLITVVGISMGKSNSILSQIENDKILRNAIVHFDGIIEEKKRNSFIIPRDILVDAWEAKIESQEYLILLIEKMQKFFSELLSEVDFKITNSSKTNIVSI